MTVPPNPRILVSPEVDTEWTKQFYSALQNYPKRQSAFVRLKQVIRESELLYRLYDSTAEHDMKVQAQRKLKKRNERMRRRVQSLSKLMTKAAKALESSARDEEIGQLMRTLEHSPSTSAPYPSPAERWKLFKQNLEVRRPLAQRLSEFAKDLEQRRENWAKQNSLKIKYQIDFNFYLLVFDAKRHPLTMRRYQTDIAFLMGAAYEAHGEDKQLTREAVRKRFKECQKRNPDVTRTWENLSAVNTDDPESQEVTTE